MTSTNKRRAEDNIDSPPKKILKAVYSIFQKPDPKKAAEDEEKMPFRWGFLGPNKSCLHGVHLKPPSLGKVAFFDLDGTIIKPTFGKRVPLSGKKAHEWEWWNPKVLTALQELPKDYAIVFVSNQGGNKDQVATFKEKLPLIAAKIPEIPFQILAATGKDVYRKPMPGMFSAVKERFKLDGIDIDETASFMVGDAAGRKNDFSSSDRKWADNLLLKFYTPEEYFLKAKAQPYELPGFKASTLATSPRDTLIPFIPKQTGAASQPEIVIFVGYPCLGKTTYYHKHFKPAGYVHVNQDTLKTRVKCIKAVEAALAEEVSCVVDNTNRDTSTRQFYVDLAKKKKVPIRCIIFNGSKELAQHNNLYRACIRPPSEGENVRDRLSDIVFNTYAKGYEEPVLGEGFSEVQNVEFAFEGTPEERKKWEMWLTFGK